MFDHPTDNAAAAVTLTAPGWATLLADVNAVLTTTSLLLGIAFLLWRWHRANRTGVDQ
ncbi:hypothetical protein J2847_004137 [Azospirillum agricola]|uniref:hypothetical protein n=1 Tax=Azospirillum agricola TaxID=1720247 RepID=UPI001AE96688|nr:hypothetical protein [Azospirillum agricola]MBP2230828.1 hypothetical protein [Azospirillum agricola]